MAGDFLDRFSRGDTLCHRLPARLKILLALAVIATAGLLPIHLWPVHGCLAAVVFMGLSIAQIPLAYLWRRVLLFSPFVLSMALAVPLSTSHGLTGSQGFASSWEIAAGIVVRACVCFLAGLWLVGVTPFDQILAAFAKFGMPRIMVDLLAFMYRYVFVLFDELGRMRTARRARTFGPRGAWAEWTGTTQLIGMLLIRSMNRAERIYGAMCAPELVGKGPAARLNSMQAPILKVEHLSFRYPNGASALTDISFSIGMREIVGLVGPNGAGKTTLLLHLNGLLTGRREPRSGFAAQDASPQNDVSRPGSPPEPTRPPQGELHAVEVLGLPVVTGNLPEVRRIVGFLFHDPDDQLFCPTVREDVAFGPLNLGFPRDEVLRRVSTCLAAVGLAGFETRGTQELSYGERRRVCLAGVLACEPSLLALDEPSSNLDPRARRGFIELLKAGDAAQIIASHDLELILELCHRVLVLDHGRLQADGPARDVLSNEKLMQAHGLEVPLSIRYGIGS